jgi:sugar lactone lactonase YvrE
MITNSKGEIIVLDYKQNRLWKVTPSKKIELLAGSSTGYKDGKSDQAQFDFKYDFGILKYRIEEGQMYLKDTFSRLEIDKNDNIYVFDKGNRAIRKVTPEGEVTTFYKTSQDEQPIYLN